MGKSLWEITPRLSRDRVHHLREKTQVIAIAEQFLVKRRGILQLAHPQHIPYQPERAPQKLPLRPTEPVIGFIGSVPAEESVVPQLFDSAFYCRADTLVCDRQEPV